VTPLCISRVYYLLNFFIIYLFTYLIIAISNLLPIFDNIIKRRVFPVKDAVNLLELICVSVVVQLSSSTYVEKIERRLG